MARGVGPYTTRVLPLLIPPHWADDSRANTATRCDAGTACTTMDPGRRSRPPQASCARPVPARRSQADAFAKLPSPLTGSVRPAIGHRNRAIDHPAGLRKSFSLPQVILGHRPQGVGVTPKRGEPREPTAQLGLLPVPFFLCHHTPRRFTREPTRARIPSFRAGRCNLNHCLQIARAFPG